jgi:hypothetical protein
VVFHLVNVLKHFISVCVKFFLQGIHFVALLLLDTSIIICESDLHYADIMHERKVQI